MSELNGYHRYVDLMPQNNLVPALAFVDIYQNPYYVSIYAAQSPDNIHKLPLNEEIFGNAIREKSSLKKWEIFFNNKRTLLRNLQISVVGLVRSKSGDKTLIISSFTFFIVSCISSVRSSFWN